jgi:hypothetical protein
MQKILAGTTRRLVVGVRRVSGWGVCYHQILAGPKTGCNAGWVAKSGLKKQKNLETPRSGSLTEGPGPTGSLMSPVVSRRWVSDDNRDAIQKARGRECRSVLADATQRPKAGSTRSWSGELGPRGHVGGGLMEMGSMARVSRLAGWLAEPRLRRSWNMVDYEEI